MLKLIPGQELKLIFLAYIDPNQGRTMTYHCCCDDIIMRSCLNLAHDGVSVCNWICVRTNGADLL